MKHKTDPSTKPYYRCLSCPRFRQTCAGLPTRDMTLAEWCEYVCDVMIKFRLTNAYVAEQAEVSLKTIERIRAINCDQDIMRATARRVELAVFGSVTQDICCLDFEACSSSEKVSQLEKELEYWKKENERNTKIIDRLLE